MVRSVARANECAAARAKLEKLCRNARPQKSGAEVVAKAILQTGLPKLQPSHASADATEEVTALAEFAHEFAEWLLSFARCLLQYKQTPNYQRARHRSDKALERKQRR